MFFMGKLLGLAMLILGVNLQPLHPVRALPAASPPSRIQSPPLLLCYSRTQKDNRLSGATLSTNSCHRGDGNSGKTRKGLLE